MKEPVTRRTDPDARRQQIVDAAASCARCSGFHGASMAEIAQEAGLSVGQIYRYFENKEAIIAAIVARDTAEIRDVFQELNDGRQPLLEAVLGKCGDALGDAYDRERAALTLEVFAEAARNPAVAQMVEAADAEQRPLKLDILSRTCPPDLSDAERRARSEVISMIFDGMAIAGLKNPSGDRAALAIVLRSVLRHLFTHPALLEDAAPGR